MQLGIIGLGRMGGNISRRLMQAGHETVVYDRNAHAVDALAKDGAAGVGGLADMVAQADPPRAVWVMLPAGAITEQTVSELAGLMQSGDTIIDGGNSLLQGRHPPRQGAEREGHHLRRRRHLRRRVRASSAAIA